MVPQLTITTEDLLNKDLCKSIMIINRMPTLAFLTMRLQFPTLRDSHLTGDQTESQSLTRINNSNSGPMEMELDQRSKTCSGIWDISQRTQHNSTSGLDTQISTPKTRKMASQVPSMDSTLRNLLDIDTITTVSNFDLLTYSRTVNNENSQGQKWWWNYERQEANSTKQFYDRVAKNVTLPNYNYDDKEP